MDPGTHPLLLLGACLVPPGPEDLARPWSAAHTDAALVCSWVFGLHLVVAGSSWLYPHPEPQRPLCSTGQTSSGSWLCGTRRDAVDAPCSRALVLGLSAMMPARASWAGQMVEASGAWQGPRASVGHEGRGMGWAVFRCLSPLMAWGHGKGPAENVAHPPRGSAAIRTSCCLI